VPRDGRTDLILLILPCAKDIHGRQASFKAVCPIHSMESVKINFKEEGGLLD
jgi:hypothetical protein